VSRNFFGAQINSFETQLPAHNALQQFGTDGKFRAVFIRAPAVIEAGPEVRLVCQLQQQQQQQQQQQEIVGTVLAVNMLCIRISTTISGHVAGPGVGWL
jgi:glutamine amidotransferase PdxT